MPDETQSPKTLFMQAAQLRIHWPDGTEATRSLDKDVLSIGRGDEGNDIAAPAGMSSISRHHLEIRRIPGGYEVLDPGSRNGVFVNEERIQQATRLKQGDRIRFGLAERNEQVTLDFLAGTKELIAAAMAEAALRPAATPGSAEEPAASRPYWEVRWPDGTTSYVTMDADRMLVGRAEDAQLRIPDALQFVSHRHFEVHTRESGFVLRDLNSTNGTYVDNQRVPPAADLPLRHNQVVRIGDEELGISIGFTFHAPRQGDQLDGFRPENATVIQAAHAITIGRAPDCDVVLDSVEVSRHHAILRQVGEQALLRDLDSSNGTYVNGQPVAQALLAEGDLIQIANYLLVYAQGTLTPYQSNGMRMDTVGLSKDVRTRKGKLRILRSVDMTVLPREFVAIVGGSGAGKTTLLNALIGYKPGQGKVKLNGQDFYSDYERFRSQLGFVPQSDILHTMLTVERALDYAARLRLPGRVSKAERRRRIDVVLNTVSMNTETIRKTRIGDLSGGQRKRVSIAAELLADPKLIFLDEATSGLDPGLEKKLMYTLRRMADEGRTVVLITHATSNIVQTDHVAFLSQGRLIYFGPSREALEYFGVEDFSDIYGLIEDHGEQWEHVFKEEKPAAYEKYVAQRAKSLRAIPQQVLPVPRLGLGGFLRQLGTLIQRNLSVLLSDPVTLALMLLLFPVTATLQLVIATPTVLTGNLSILADPVTAARTMLTSYIPLSGTNTFVFVMGLDAVLVGLYVPPNELIRERSIYLRERTVNLQVLPYLLSKVLIYAVFAVVQVALYMAILSIGVRFPAHGLYLPGTLELAITLLLTLLAGIGTGMIVAAISRSTDMAIYILVMMLFFEFYFAGPIFNLRGNRFEPLSYLTATRWGANAIGVTVNMDKLAGSTILCNNVPSNPLDPAAGTKTVCFNYPDARKDLNLSYGNSLLLQSWLVLGLRTILSIAITALLLKRMDAGS